MTPTALWNHKHVSERESAHWWPDGRWDNAAWEDCGWDTLIEFVRMTMRANIPATHAEAERVRRLSGEDTASGSHSGNFNKGLKVAYGLGPLETHSDQDVLNTPVGFAAHVSGSMGVFPFGHRLRRWDADFRGAHRWLIFHLSQGWYLCDPLAPATYQGEFITKADLAKFMGGLPFGDHFIRPMLPKPTPLPPDPTPIGKVRVNPGAFFLYDVNGNPTSGYDATTREPKKTAGGFSGTIGKRINKLANGKPVVWEDAERDWVLITDPKSAYSGAWLDLNAGEVSLVTA